MGRLLALAACLSLAAAAHAVDTDEGMEDPVLNARYRALIVEVRCLVCQNQTIADSNADLAADLRREIREMLAAGSSDAEISSFLVERYGDFVLYRPPLKPTTWALWGGPAAMLALGALIFVRVLRSRAGQSLDDADLDDNDASAQEEDTAP